MGKVGPFFYLDGKLYKDAAKINDAEKYGEFKTWGSHDKLWELISRSIRKNRDYTQCPRGRVTYNFVNEKYFVYLNPKLNKNEILKIIIEEFNLSGLKYSIDDTDDHYSVLF